MKLVVLQAGKLREKQVIALRDDYVQRFRRYGQLAISEVAKPGAAGIWPATRCWKVLVDETGEQLGSEALAARLADWTMRHGTVAFAIGEAYGHDAATRQLADAKLSLGALTLPHQLAHLILVEQLYRAASILAGSPYHHGEAGA
jgi:23S rRNA (pseudouridine1915-N3)-methyltransferase